MFYKGVVIDGDQVIKDIPSVFKKFRKDQKKIYFLTNNSTRSRKQLVQKLNKIGIYAEKVSKILAIIQTKELFYIFFISG